MFETIVAVFSMAVPAGRLILVLSPIWLPILLVVLWWKAWVTYRRTSFITSKEPVLLEIRIPKETNKSPLAMELALSGFYSTSGEGTLKDKYIKGGVRAWYSLELVSLEGQVKFFVWTWRNNMKNIQNNLYAQYPTIEIVEVPDYTLAFLYDKDRADIYAAEFTLSKPDPYPIKTYVDYGLDRDPKEEFKIDPITPILEYLGGLGKGEQAWIQIIIRAHKGEDKKAGGIFGAIKSFEDLFEFVPKIKDQLKGTDKWKDDVKDEIQKIIDKRKIKSKDTDDKKIELTPFEKDVITALERSISKTPFDVGIRAVYLGEKDAFNQAHKGALNGVLAQYNTLHLNGFKRATGTSFDYWHQDPFGTKLPRMKRELFQAYRERGWFHPPYKNQHIPGWRRTSFVLNAEELATVFHFPGGVAQTPTFSRIESRKAEPPVNLPV